MQNNNVRALARAGVVAVLCMGLAACAGFAHKDKDDQAVVTKTNAKPVDDTPVTPPAQAKPEGHSTADELRALIAQRKVQELRTTYNGRYGASMLFKPDTLTYYVALFQGKSFWRVVKTDSRRDAEKDYRKFSGKSAELAKSDLRSITLQAQYEHTQKQVNERLEKVNTLQSDLEAQRRQQQLIAAQQEQARKEAEKMAKQQADARRRLSALQAQIKQLQEKQAALSASGK